MNNTIIEKIFSVKNKNERGFKRKVITILGVKIKFTKGKNSQKTILPYLETHLCDHCNLNCKGCGHCSPLSPEKFSDLEQFKKDIKELSTKLSIGQIRLMGGEPLLHPQVNEFIKATRESFPETDIRIVTNGILLPTMQEDFWETLRNNRVVVDLTKYPPVGNKFSEYLDLIDDNDVTLGHINLAKKFFNQSNSKGDSDIVQTFKDCFSKYCVNLWKSRLYNCPACYMTYYNEYYKENIKIQEGLDIYKLSGAQLKDKLNKPIEQCRFCKTDELKRYEWAQSQKQKQEWTME